MITADQVLAHMAGDYILQSDWMATEKTKQHLAAAVHAFVYSLSFLLFRPSLAAWLVIFVTHFFIDRYRLARYVVWAKNLAGARRYWWRSGSGEKAQYAVTDCGVCPIPPSLTDGDKVWYQPTPPFSVCAGTGYPPTSPAWLAVWLMIIADNILHVSINGLALRFL